jgi:hypothetical protein
MQKTSTSPQAQTPIKRAQKVAAKAQVRAMAHQVVTAAVLTAVKATAQYVNSGLNAGSIVSNSDNLTIEGGNLNATDTDITTDNLVVSSVQDTGQSSSKSSGGSVGFGASNNVGI